MAFFDWLKLTDSQRHIMRPPGANQQMLAKADKALAADKDHMVADESSIDWLIAQLANWPIRVDERKTTNMRFLMASAAATLLAIRETEA